MARVSSSSSESDAFESDSEEETYAGDSLEIQEQKKSITLHVGDVLMYNGRTFTAGSKAARRFSTIVEFHKNKKKTNPIELHDGYIMELGDLFRIHKRSDGSTPKEEDTVTKQMRWYRFSWKDQRWKGETNAEQIKKMSKKAQEDVNDLIVDFLKTDGKKYAKQEEE